MSAITESASCNAPHVLPGLHAGLLSKACVVATGYSIELRCAGLLCEELWSLRNTFTKMCHARHSANGLNGEAKDHVCDCHLG